MTADCTCCAGRYCQTSVLGKRDHLFSGKEQVWRRMDRPFATSSPLRSTHADLLDDEIMCSEVLPIAGSSNAIYSSSPLLKEPIYSPFSSKVELFRLRSERACDSDEEEEMMAFDAEDIADNLNSLLVREERQEGIRRFRSSIDDEHRLAHCERTKRELPLLDVPLLMEKEEPGPSVEALTLERDSRAQVKPSFISQRLLCFLVAATIGLGFAALWRNNHQNSGSNFMTIGRTSLEIEPPVQHDLASEQSIDQRPGSLRLENLQNRNRLSFF